MPALALSVGPEIVDAHSHIVCRQYLRSVASL
uniref:Uncharacterized protein n=1 Tax=uncultured marine bacterium 581 TaxID=257401 RepID=Q6SFF0_9BACT|nr:hypothetical protein MBMO_EBAC000-69B03.17 [uncultured marine bacterium 581]